MIQRIIYVKMKSNRKGLAKRVSSQYFLYRSKVVTIFVCPRILGSQTILKVMQTWLWYDDFPI